jgi:aspartyl-tRNA(Asn)/glutamyl-tRNA(Gln) amidotransferase subunit B
MYTATIGLEVHAELKTSSKMFCGCKNNPHEAEPNTLICPVCLAHPGTLPVPNRTAIEYVLRFGVAVGGETATYSEFDRKNYFYPDIPKAYQLSQYAFPFVKGGVLAGVELTRVHLEEDTARSQHDKGDGSLVDYNRAGVPLMELVTEPVIHDAEAAGRFARELQLLLRTIGISDANMEKGEMRVEANISVSDSDTLGTKVEVKNLNSFRSMEMAIEYEIKRHTQLLEAGESVEQETRGWDEEKKETYLQRKKETAKDYRYFPDPDIPKYQIDTVPGLSNTSLAEKLPVLPSEKRQKYSVLGLTSNQIETIIQDIRLDTFFSECLRDLDDNTALVVPLANYLITDLVPAAKDSFMPASEFVYLMSQVSNKKITSRVAKDLIIEFGADPRASLKSTIADRNLCITADTDAVRALVMSVVTAHPQVVAEYKAGKLSVIQFLLGQAMKESRGAADPVFIRNLLEEALQS